MGRAPCCDKANVKRGPWSPEEDAKLKEYIHKHGPVGNWIAFPQKAGFNRCGKSCRLRWLNYLRPNIKHGDFTENEDRIICSLYANIGSRWSIIAAQLSGRTDNDIKNYWNTKLKKKLMARPMVNSSTRTKHNRANQCTDTFSHLQASSPIPSSPSTSTTLSSSSTSPYRTIAYNYRNALPFTSSPFCNYFTITSTAAASLMQQTHENLVSPTMQHNYNNYQHQMKDGFHVLGADKASVSSFNSDNYGINIVGSVNTNNSSNDNSGSLLGGLESDYSLDYYGLEEIKHLISRSSIPFSDDDNARNETDKSSDNYNIFLFDENKTGEKNVVLF